MLVIGITTIALQSPKPQQSKGLLHVFNVPVNLPVWVAAQRENRGAVVTWSIHLKDCQPFKGGTPTRDQTWVYRK